MDNTLPGCLISFEGIDGCGKSTQVELLRDSLVHSGVNVVCTRSLGGTPSAEAIRAAVLSKDMEPLSKQTEILMMYASRLQTNQEVVLPALARGDTVIIDRYEDSTKAYQAFTEDDLDKRLELIQLIDYLNCTVNLKPEYTFLIDIPVSVAQQRITSRCLYLDSSLDSTDRFDASTSEFFTKVRNGFLALLEENPGRIKIIDGCQSARVIADLVQQGLPQDLFDNRPLLRNE